MENTGGSDDLHRSAGYGPRPGAGRSPHPLSRSRAALLDTLRAQVAPTTLTALAAATGLHANTIREHLHALIRAGLAHRHPAEPDGRGRPAWLYEAVGADAAGASEYAGLAATLAATIHRTSPSPTEDAIRAGREWGAHLVRERGVSAPPPDASPPDAAAARRQVVALLDDMGFAPQADAHSTTVALTRCPLLEAAHKYPDVVCGVHLGLVQAALEEYGAESDGVELVPFAEPGACRLHLQRRTR